MVACIEEATNDGGQKQDDERLCRTDQVEEQDVLAWEEVLHVVRGVCAVSVDDAPAIEHAVVGWSAVIPEGRVPSCINSSHQSTNHLQEEATEQASICSPLGRPVRLGLGVDMTL